MIIDIDEFIKLKKPIVIDMRTKIEYDKGHIHNALSFEILSYNQRKEVSVLYNEGHHKASYLLAYKYALDKLPKLFEIIQKHMNREIVFYCARGGSRSSIVYNVFSALPGISIYKLKGGFKNYRRYANDALLRKAEDLKTKVLHYPMAWQFFNNDHRNVEVIDMNDYTKASLFNTKRDYFNFLQFKLDVFNKVMIPQLKEIVIIDLNSRRIYKDLAENLKVFYIQGTHKLIDKPIELRKSQLLNQISRQNLVNDINHWLETQPKSINDKIENILKDKTPDEKELGDVIEIILHELDKDFRVYLSQFNID